MSVHLSNPRSDPAFSALLREVIIETRSRFAVSAVAGRVGVNLKKAGREWVACCPFHADASPTDVEVRAVQLAGDGERVGRAAGGDR